MRRNENNEDMLVSVKALDAVSPSAEMLVKIERRLEEKDLIPARRLIWFAAACIALILVNVFAGFRLNEQVLGNNGSQESNINELTTDLTLYGHE